MHETSSRVRPAQWTSSSRRTIRLLLRSMVARLGSDARADREGRKGIVRRRKLLQGVTAGEVEGLEAVVAEQNGLQCRDSKGS